MLKNALLNQRYAAFLLAVLAFVASLVGGLFHSGWLLIPTALAGALVLLGVHDMRQRKHSILRNYPVIGHLRFLMESIRPEIRQ
ncbi:MAG: FMN-binding glutamate synthase family protein, partial [Proteobacteria bacterium]|nr:FMN-binding glutamate synthase family protein [Pseudomonadota bacterium]